MEVVRSYGINTSCNFQSARSSTLALTRCQSCKKVMWGRVIQTDLVTWSFKVWGHNMHIMYKNEWRNSHAKFRGCAPRFPTIYEKPPGGGGAECGYPPTSVRGLRSIRVCISFDASWWAEHNDTMHADVTIFYIKLIAKKWPLMTPDDLKAVT